MQLICLSVSYHNTPVELRECLSLSSDDIDAALTQHPVQTGLLQSVSELAILSTCNRLEIYALVPGAEGAEAVAAQASQPVLAYMREIWNIPVSRVEPYLQIFAGPPAVRHLFEVAAGLDSIALGETQILGQVIRALEISLRLGCARHVLSTLFRSAIHAGKRVHSETEIGRSPTSISTVAVQLAEAWLGNLAQQHILVIGAGKMGGYAVEALQAHGASHLVLTNRTYEHAADLAGRFGGRVLPYEQLSEGLIEADLVFASTAASTPIIQVDLITRVIGLRPNRPLMLIDLAVPRNVEGAVRQVLGAQVVDMDDLQRFVQTSAASQYQDLALAKSIVADEVAEFEKLLRVTPFLGELHKKAEHIRQEAIRRALGKLRDPDPQVSEQLELLSRSLVRKLLHEPTMHLRTVRNPETLNHYVDVLSQLFELNETEPNPLLPHGDIWQP
jgi:glutamyl-tRNA reductase